MRRLAARCSLVAVMGAGLLLTSGCRTRFWPFGKGPQISPDYSTAGTAPGEVATSRPADEGAAAGGWEPTTGSLARRLGEVVPIQDQRWKGLVVYFAFDRSDIGTAERPKLEQLAALLKDNPPYCVIIEGHADDRGSDEYNRGLGERRALAVRDFLVAAGVADTRMETVSYGEERPAVPNANSEEDHTKNRRCEFVIGTLKR